jgi:hypothetical protein
VIATPAVAHCTLLHASVGGGDLNRVLWCSSKRQTDVANQRYAIAPLDGRPKQPVVILRADIK